MQITKVSQATGIEHTREIDVDPLAYFMWESRQSLPVVFIQNIFLHLSADDREFLISGTTPEEWDELFPDVEEDEEDDYTGYAVWDTQDEQESGR